MLWYPGLALLLDPALVQRRHLTKGAPPRGISPPAHEPARVLNPRSAPTPEPVAKFTARHRPGARLGPPGRLPLPPVGPKPTEQGIRTFQTTVLQGRKHPSKQTLGISAFKVA